MKRIKLLFVAVFIVSLTSCTKDDVITEDTNQEETTKDTEGTNTGDTNTGDTNTGDTNTGDTNTGDTNTGDTNTGDTNTGDTGVVNKLILGVWKGVSHDYSSVTVSESALGTLNSVATSKTTESDFTLEFTDNPKEAVGKGTYKAIVTATVYGQTSSGEAESIFDAKYTWKEDGDNIILNTNGLIIKLKIIELTSTSLKYEQVIKTVDEGQGYKNTTTTTSIVVYTK